MGFTGVALISLLNNIWAKEKFFNQLSSVELVKNLLSKMPEIRVEHFIRDDENDVPFYSTLFPNSIPVKPEIFSFLDQCVKTFSDCESVIFLYTDSPLNDLQTIQDLLTLHQHEMAEYSFTENFPTGIGAEILSYHTLNVLKNIASGNNEIFNRSSISKIINFDINRYDVEVLVSDRDMRKERLSLICSDYRNFLIVQNFIQQLNQVTLKEIYSLIDSQPQVMRSVPAYFEIEITNDCNCQCLVCPRTKLMTRPIQNMPLENYHSLIDQIKSFCDNAHIALTLLGEPTLHPQLMTMIELTLSKPGLTLILETNAILLDRILCDKIISLSNDNLIVIVALDSPAADVYQSLRSIDSLNKVEANVSYLLERRPQQTYIQILRVQENNHLLDLYFQKWNAYKSQIIIQKYNSYCNQLEDRKGVDLSPLRRFSCWHLKRDLVVLVDGTVPFCKQDINGEKSVGNIFKEGLEAVWKKIEPCFVQDHLGNLDNLCQNCDEWFTYNF